jgi:hypothetical protein
VSVIDFSISRSIPRTQTETVTLYLGRHVFGLAAIFFGIIALVWQDFNGWQQIRALGAFPQRAILLYIVAAAELFGGVAIQWHRTTRAGAVALGIVYFAFALLWLPFITAKPLSYDPWGNFFEQFSLVSGALIIYASADRSPSHESARLGGIGYLCFCICVVSFTLEQIFYLAATASFVPKWLPPGQMFWAITTTIAFTLATIALFSGRSVALLASRLLTAMIVSFGLLVWLPVLAADPHKLFNWAGNAENLAIAGAAWIVTDYLSQNRFASKA